MTVLKVRDVVSNLKYKGFEEDPRSHKYLRLFVNGKETSIFTFVSHGSKEINDFLIGKMAYQTSLERREFIDLATCPLSRDDYLKKLTQQGKLEV